MSVKWMSTAFLVAGAALAGTGSVSSAQEADDDEARTLGVVNVTAQKLPMR